MTELLKSVVFRVPLKTKQEFRVALIRYNLDVQHCLEAFAEHLIAYEKGEKVQEPMKSIIKRAQILSSKEI